VIAIVDFGIGNFASLGNMLDYVGGAYCQTDDPFRVAQSGKLILPGVGSFGRAMEELKRRRLDEAIMSAVERGASILGVCLGMQMLAQHSEEGAVDGLGILQAQVRQLKPTALGVKVPNMGWRTVTSTGSSSLFGGSGSSHRFYFAHSYEVVCEDPADVIASTWHGKDIVAAVCRDNVHGVQFHPEKSHRHGMMLLTRFCKL